jgi:hypothetical protein
MIGRNFYLMSLAVLALAAPSFAQTAVCVPQFVDGTSGSCAFPSLWTAHRARSGGKPHSF